MTSQHPSWPHPVPVDPQTREALAAIAHTRAALSLFPSWPRHHNQYSALNTQHNDPTSQYQQPSVHHPAFPTRQLCCQRCRRSDGLTQMPDPTQQKRVYFKCAICSNTAAGKSSFVCWADGNGVYKENPVCDCGDSDGDGGPRAREEWEEEEEGVENGVEEGRGEVEACVDGVGWERSIKTTGIGLGKRKRLVYKCATGSCGFRASVPPEMGDATGAERRKDSGVGM
ncbi:uncharacterized protein BCR38DRAFT_183241 [Pseudomassariella vexata]|uniref:Uncharacterized protein n=1 Tax=Pseudomassariella vexata TaxID=1141098 RepID=A0A1Y2E4T0_9PEZI|nr:uncharacterized protein BCR38DRAFT_183241 [Pseudomassariella vexata]ORY66573.1 hypothetical protein BCR38DRAFT_183241 [Pseudomassariella vexata]